MDKKPYLPSRIAYNIGFSSSLSRDSWSAYNELHKWADKRHFNPKEVRLFLLGYMDGVKLIGEVRQEFRDFIRLGAYDFLVAEAVAPV